MVVAEDKKEKKFAMIWKVSKECDPGIMTRMKECVGICGELLSREPMGDEYWVGCFVLL